MIGRKPIFCHSVELRYLKQQKVYLPLRNYILRHILIAPFHPSSNVRAERTVRSVKVALSKMGPGDWHTKIEKYLLMQHATPCPESNQSPAEQLMGRRIKTNLDRLHPTYSPEKP